MSPELERFIREHPLPWSMANTLIWDGNDHLIDIGRREVRELLVELINRWGATKEEEHGKGDR